MTPPTASQHADQWDIRGRTLHFGRLPLIMGIINITPDSFSDGGKYLDTDAAVRHALKLAAEGADILDIGGESTRPGAEAVDTDEERRRIVPVIRRIAEISHVAISVDTTKAEVAMAAIDAGAHIINDISAFDYDPHMLDVARSTDAGICIMHMQGTPRTMQQSPRYDDVTAEVFHYLISRRDALVKAGIPHNRIALDPGIGFGKTLEHNLKLLTDINKLVASGSPVLVGHSRKSYIGHLLNDPNRDRTPGTIGTALAMAAKGVQVLRVHDVCAVRDALTLFEQSGGLDSA